MLLTKEQVKKLPEGTICKVFYSGWAWDNDFGKSYNAIKVNGRLYHYKDFDDIEDMNDKEYSFEVAINENSYKLLLSNKKL